MHIHFYRFKKLYEDIKSERTNILYYTKIQLLSKENIILSRMFELCDKLNIFLNDVKPELAVDYNKAKFIACLAYLADIFASFNTLNLKMQRKEKTLLVLWI